MKRKILATALMLICCLLVLAGCKGGNSDLMTLAKDKSTDFKVVSYCENADKVKGFVADLVIKTSTKFQRVEESAAGDHAIYVGTDKQMKGKGGTSAKMNTATCYEILIHDGNIYVCAGSEDIIDTVLEKLMEHLVKIEKGLYGIEKELEIRADFCPITETIPMFQSATATASELHDCGNDNYLTIYSYLNISDTQREIDTYAATLKSKGFTLVQENDIVGNQFALYSKGDAMVHYSYFPAKREFRMVYGSNKYILPNPTPITDYEKRVTPCVINPEMSENEECVILQLADGSFIVIDGGWGTSGPQTKTLNAGAHNERVVNYKRDVETDMARVYTLMKERTPDGGKPQVIWMITHADPDHITMPTRFFKDYKDKFDLNMIIANFPNLFNIGLGTGTSDNDPVTMTEYANNFLSAARTYFPGVTEYVYHTGEKLYLPGCECEFLITPGEDLWPGVMNWMNHTSGTWRFTIEGKTVMIPGDAESSLCNLMVGLYGSYLKSDILQPNHHGANGATRGFYACIDPSICIWQCQQYHLDYDNRQCGVANGYDFNKFLRTSKNVKAHLSTSYTSVISLPSLEIQ